MHSCGRLSPIMSSVTALNHRGLLLSFLFSGIFQVENFMNMMSMSHWDKSCRFFGQFFLMFIVHQVSISLFRLIAALAPNPSVAATSSLFSLLVIFLFGGFVIPKRNSPHIMLPCILQETNQKRIAYGLCLFCSFSTWLVEVGVLAFSSVLCGNRNFDQWISCSEVAKGSNLRPTLVLAYPPELMSVDSTSMMILRFHLRILPLGVKCLGSSV